MNVLSPIRIPAPAPPEDKRLPRGVCLALALVLSLGLWVGIFFGMKACVQTGMDLWKRKELLSTATRPERFFESIASIGTGRNPSIRKFSARTN